MLCEDRYNNCKQHTDRLDIEHKDWYYSTLCRSLHSILSVFYFVPIVVAILVQYFESTLQYLYLYQAIHYVI